MAAMHAALLLLLLHAASPPAAAHPDRDALLAFKAAVSDPLGTLNAWNQTTPFCRWPGVTCSPGRPRRVTALDVSHGGLAGPISPAIGNLTSLEVLNAIENALSGAIPPAIGRLRRLRYLGLCGNSLRGEIPPALRNCTALSDAYLNNNRLTGEIPGWLGSLTSLAALTLGGGNLFTGSIPPSLGNLTLLKRLELDNNVLEGTLPEGLAQLGSLHYLDVYQNRLAGAVPSWLFNMSALVNLTLANNDFRGQLPPPAGRSMPQLEYILLGGNHLTGPIPAALANATGIEILSLANNSFAGAVPPELGMLCPVSLEMSNNLLTAADGGGWEFLAALANCSRLEALALDGNMLGGTLPSAVANLSPQLQSLLLGSNRLSGTIPADIGNLIGLQKLGLGSNRLTGTIPAGIGKLTKLEELSLEHNQLEGAMPSSLGNLAGLLTLVAGNNLLNGTIPRGLGSLQHLTALNLSGNALSGPIPGELFQLSSISSVLDLSNNRLVGPLPHGVGRLKNLAQMVLSGNSLSGEIPSELGSCESLEYLDLDGNFFDGSIPPSLSNLRGLRRLNLTRNNLSGRIPQELGRMTGLEELYLSRNALSGGIPELLQNLSSLVKLDLSYNHLEGPVPLGGVFANATGFTMLGNDGLCGGAAQLRLPPCPQARHRDLLLKIAIPLTGSLVACFIFLLAFRLLRLGRKPNSTNDTALLAEEGMYPRVTYAELAAVTEHFADANLIGAGKYGSVYRGILPLRALSKGAVVASDVAVAVKVYNLRQVGASKTFLAECEALRRIRHRNLIGIITCCSSVDLEGNEFKALVLELMPNCSLDRWLHPRADEYRLSLLQRLRIAVDIADALDYLHNNCEPSVIHCDLKPSNILLDADFTARIGDFGLTKLLLDRPSGSATSTNVDSNSIAIRGTIGYVAPEYGTSGLVSTSGDVYSFGVTLLEIFIGKAPTDDAFRDGLTLYQFVSMAFPERIAQVIDPVLLPIEGDAAAGAGRVERDCLVSVLRVGLSCSKQVPSERMCMKDAAPEMHKIRDAFLSATYFS